MVQVPTTSGSSTSATMGGPRETQGSNTPLSSNGAKTKAQVNGGAHPLPAPTYFSAMRSLPLDLMSVERRGQPTASRELPKRARPHGLLEAPTYRPTEEEFRDPFEYMKKISEEASRYGICKIIPPDSWKPDFAVDTERFHFRTRKQELNSVEGSTRANLTYLDQLAKFHKQHGTNLNRFPSVDKRPLDLYKLKKAVESRGGFEKVCKLKKWAEIGRDLGYSGKIMSSLSTSLKNSYQRWLFPYEEYLRFAKPGVHQQLEFEYGGPLTPSPGTSPFKKSHQQTASSLHTESPTMRASDALNAHIKEPSNNRNPPVPHMPVSVPGPGKAPAPTPPQSVVAAPGFTPVNTGGFTAVNGASASFAPVNMSLSRRETEKSFTPNRRLPDSPLSSSKNTPEYRPLVLGPIAVTNGVTCNPLKRQLSYESSESRKENNAPHEESDNGGRRSKRLKKDAIPTVAGSHMTLLKPTAPKISRESASGVPGERCGHCGKAEDLEKLLICESCDHGYHMYCLDNPVTSKPDYDWYCPRCLVGDGQFGFEEGGIYSLKQFQDKAADFKEDYFRNRLPFDPVLNCLRPVTEDDIEHEFWRLVASLEETVEVEYGADIHSTTHGSGFPTPELNPRDPYSTDPWNLNIMPLHQDSLFRHIKSDISGMTVPWLYVGMIFSTFCWHNEDHYAYSANYQHFGSTKTWYGIPAADADNFEQAMREAVPELFETQPDLLFQLVTLLTPEQLRKAGVRVYALDQRAGQFVITFPQAYHAGFNHGFNFNEAVNFAPSDWEPYGDAGVERLQEFRRQPCFSHDELLWTAAEGHATNGVTIQTAKWLRPALQRMRTREVEQRKLFIGKHKERDHPCVITDSVVGAEPRCHIGHEIDENDLPEEEYQCSHCKAYSYLSRFKCKTSGKVLCLMHAGSYACCECPEEQRYAGDKHVLYYRRTEEQITAIVDKVSERAQLPDAWEEKFASSIEGDATPQLKTLKALLNEGERIPYDIPSLKSLKDFVDKCVEWVEEATNYIVRKQQNRRRSEKYPRKPSKAAEQEERERELRKVANITKLLKEADELGFECPEITQLRERSEAINGFQHDARLALENPHVRTTSDFEELLELGRTYNVDMPELDQLETHVQQKRWMDKAREAGTQFLALKDVVKLLDDASELGISPFNEFCRHFKEQREAGEAWEIKAKEVMSYETVHYPQLEALSTQAQAAGLPVSATTLAEIDRILNKQREAHRQIIALFERCRDPEVINRPRYQEVKDTMDALSELNSKPNGTLDLEKEQKRHEDWMRKGKKLFGKANAPLHILKSHMEYVLERNLDCFDITSDKPRSPAEPASREPSPEDGKVHSWEDPRFREVFCICRRVEAGMMIECELCHEWYHGKCLKIARGKVKDDEKYTCPICDWRLKIPRDAARPKLEDLQAWQDEIQNLPFQPDEEQVLENIINNALDFRAHVAPYCNPIMATSEEAETQRFFLRKIEGAEILLSFETNFFRQELHKWSPVAPEPPPLLEVSKSTRKPRPTKIQKLMQQHGVENPDDLPAALRTKQHQVTKRKSSEPTTRPPQLQPAPGRSESGTPQSHHFPENGLQTGAHDAACNGSPEPKHPLLYDPRAPYNLLSNSASSNFGGHTYLNTHNDLPSSGLGSHPTSRDPTVFTGAGLARRDPHLGTLTSPMRQTFPSKSAPGLNGNHALSMDRMFNDLTDQEDDNSQERIDGRGGATKSYTEATLENLREGKSNFQVEGESEFLNQVSDYEDRWAA